MQWIFYLSLSTLYITTIVLCATIEDKTTLIEECKNLTKSHTNGSYLISTLVEFSHKNNGSVILNKTYSHHQLHEIDNNISNDTNRNRRDIGGGYKIRMTIKNKRPTNPLYLRHRYRKNSYKKAIWSEDYDDDYSALRKYRNRRRFMLRKKNIMPNLHCKCKFKSSESLYSSSSESEYLSLFARLGKDSMSSSSEESDLSEQSDNEKSVNLIEESIDKTMTSIEKSLQKSLEKSKIKSAGKSKEESIPESEELSEQSTEVLSEKSEEKTTKKPKPPAKTTMSTTVTTITEEVTKKPKKEVPELSVRLQKVPLVAENLIKNETSTVPPEETTTEEVKITTTEMPLNISSIAKFIETFTEKIETTTSSPAELPTTDFMRLEELFSYSVKPRIHDDGESEITTSAPEITTKEVPTTVKIEKQEIVTVEPKKQETVTIEPEILESTTTEPEEQDDATIEPKLHETTTLQPEKQHDVTDEPEEQDPATTEPVTQAAVTVEPEAASIEPETQEHTTIKPEIQEDTTIKPETQKDVTIKPDDQDSVTVEPVTLEPEKQEATTVEIINNFPPEETTTVPSESIEDLGIRINEDDPPVSEEKFTTVAPKIGDLEKSILNSSEETTEKNIETTEDIIIDDLTTVVSIIQDDVIEDIKTTEEITTEKIVTESISSTVMPEIPEQTATELNVQMSTEYDVTTVKSELGERLLNEDIEEVVTENLSIVNTDFPVTEENIPEVFTESSVGEGVTGQRIKEEDETTTFEPEYFEVTTIKPEEPTNKEQEPENIGDTTALPKEYINNLEETTTEKSLDELPDTEKQIEEEILTTLQPDIEYDTTEKSEDITEKPIQQRLKIEDITTILPENDIEINETTTQNPEDELVITTENIIIEEKILEPMTTLPPAKEESKSIEEYTTIKPNEESFETLNESVTNKPDELIITDKEEEVTENIPTTESGITELPIGLGERINANEDTETDTDKLIKDIFAQVPETTTKIPVDNENVTKSSTEKIPIETTYIVPECQDLLQKDFQPPQVLPQHQEIGSIQLFPFTLKECVRQLDRLRKKYAPYSQNPQLT